jgi:large subunit ribosomal protein L21
VYAIICTGGKQYRVSEGDTIYVEKLDNEAGDIVTFPVMMISGETIAVGNPYIAGATVTGKIVRQLRGEKIRILKYKSKKNYRRKAGHRQPYTQVEITGING